MRSAVLAELAVRYGLVLLFLPFSALDKVLNFGGAVAQAREVFHPRSLATAVLMTGLCIEVFASVAIVAGVADRLAALVMAGYCALTALLFKQFWKPGDFWSDPGGRARSLFWDFLKNLSLGAGFLLIAVGLDGSGWGAFLDRPLDSTHPYAQRHSSMQEVP